MRHSCIKAVSYLQKQSNVIMHHVSPDFKMPRKVSQVITGSTCDLQELQGSSHGRALGKALP